MHHRRNSDRSRERRRRSGYRTTLESALTRNATFAIPKHAGNTSHVNRQRTVSSGREGADRVDESAQIGIGTSSIGEKPALQVAVFASEEPLKRKHLGGFGCGRAVHDKAHQQQIQLLRTAAAAPAKLRELFGRDRHGVLVGAASAAKNAPHAQTNAAHCDPFAAQCDAAFIHTDRLASIAFFISAMAFAGLSPFGQVFAQFMIVWQR